MAVLINELFFPQYDTHVNQLPAVFSFCSTFIFRPLGALLFGWTGDNIGWKSTIIITTILISFSCIVMANLPTYAQVGASAAWIVTICHIVQGMSSMGARVGAKLYLTESVGVPKHFPAVAFVGRGVC
ncbi:MFS transporter [Rickettsia sp. 2024-CO-Wats]|uniref:MFS transporter n=1 Tax=unclassified Rickettsia TaxID=114295 RepID=UPI00370DA497